MEEVLPAYYNEINMTSRLLNLSTFTVMHQS